MLANFNLTICLGQKIVTKILKDWFHTESAQNFIQDWLILEVFQCPVQIPRLKKTCFWFIAVFSTKIENCCQENLFHVVF